MKDHSLLRKYKEDGLIDSKFETQLSKISLEDLISLKLEVAAKTVRGKMYGFPIYFSLPDISKEAAFKWAVSISDTKANAARLLGISLSRFNQIYKKLDIENFFRKKT